VGGQVSFQGLEPAHALDLVEGLAHLVQATSGPGVVMGMAMGAIEYVRFGRTVAAGPGAADQRVKPVATPTPPAGQRRPFAF
jgi:hypothetical protein